MNKSTKPPLKYRMCVPLDAETSDKLDSVAKVLGTSKAAVLNDIISEAVPELHSSLVSCLAVIDDKSPLAARSNIAVFSIRRMAHFFDEIINKKGTLS